MISKSETALGLTQDRALSLVKPDGQTQSRSRAGEPMNRGRKNSLSDVDSARIGGMFGVWATDRRLPKCSVKRMESVMKDLEKLKCEDGRLTIIFDRDDVRNYVAYQKDKMGIVQKISVTDEMCDHILTQWMIRATYAEHGDLLYELGGIGHELVKEHINDLVVAGVVSKR